MTPTDRRAQVRKSVLSDDLDLCFSETAPRGIPYRSISYVPQRRNETIDQAHQRLFSARTKSLLRAVPPLARVNHLGLEIEGLGAVRTSLRGSTLEHMSHRTDLCSRDIVASFRRTPVD